MKSSILKFAAMLALLGSGAANAQIQAIPPNVSPAPNLPMVVLNVSKDYSMFSRAYTDYEDLNFDGSIDYFFLPYFKYYGYFDPTKCYSYSTQSGNFVPDSFADREAVAGDPAGSKRYYCAAASATTSNLWSGNFLNWATMSRMDVLRKILYGGLRSTDEAGSSGGSGKTVLEMAFVPRNSQAYAKYYNGSDLIRLTPFSYSRGLTLCRRHENPGSSDTQESQVSSLRPVIRAAEGNYILWNMTEVLSCNWAGENGYTWQVPTVRFMTDNYVGAGGASTHSSSIPSVAGEYLARVEACKKDLVGEERCKQYPNKNLKPIGLLNEFGESDDYGRRAARAEFAMFLGSFDTNLDGGVLRKNMSEVNDEIDAQTGVFKSSSDANERGIIYSLNQLRPFGYNPKTGKYSKSCTSDNIKNGDCPAWGNPIGEILLEGLRYYAGKAPLYSGGSNDAQLGLPSPAWIDPLKANPTHADSNKTREGLYGKNICRPLNMVTISSGVATFDGDKMSALDDRSSGMGAPRSAAYYTNLIGGSAQEGISSTTRLAGSNGTAVDGICTGKLIGDLSLVAGLCPEAPNMRGTYLGAGAAYYAHVNRIRSDLTVPADANSNVLKVRQYAVTMSGGSASIRIPVPRSNPQKYVFITPASIDWSGATPLPGNMVDFKVLRRGANGESGTFLVLWQHQALGEDQDQDMLGSIRYETDSSTTPPTLRVFTQTLESNTGVSKPFAFGYTMVGSDKDGSHFHSSINNYVSSESTATYAASSVQTEPRNTEEKCYLNDDGSRPSGWSYARAPRLCVKIGSNFVKGETQLSYQMLGSSDAVIQDPLWYVAKYGGFRDDEKKPTGLPDAVSKWDAKRADGAACGAAGQPGCNDGIPDNYFLARRPDLLEESLRQVFADITGNSNSAPAVSRPDLRAGDFKYVANFSASDLHGELLAYRLDTAGNFVGTPAAKGHVNLTNAGTRAIITNLGTAGVPFTYVGLDVPAGAGYLAELDASSTSVRRDIINYMRGTRTKEKLSGGTFRDRNSDSIMGGVVNSNPWLQDLPVANFFGPAFPGYGKFKSVQKSRPKLVWVGAGDGMFHAFTADALMPVMSYVPQALASRLKEIPNATVTDMRAYADGSPFTADVMTSARTDPWKTYLFSSLGRGAKAIFALDVTSPGRLTEGNAAETYKWQFTAADDADLGYVISEGGTHPASNQAAQVAKMANGKFAVLFGNGVSSTSGKTVLYILFVDGPNSDGKWVNNTHYKRLEVGTAGGNGLMQPTWLDTNDDGIADAIYAGDLKGNMWKFDVSSAEVTEWKEAYGKPLYVALDASNNRLPITTAPALRFHPNGGQIVVFGTGQSIFSGDFPDTGRSHRIFGIWDKASYAANPGTIPSGVTDLQERSWSLDAKTDAVVQNATSAVDWSTRKGWYVGIPMPSGMVLSNPKATGKDVNIPIVYKKAAEGVVCAASAAGADVQVNGVTGVSTTNLFGIAGAAGEVIGIVGLDQRFAIPEDSTSRCAAGLSCSRIVGPNTDVTMRKNTTQSRIFWREIPGLKTTVEKHR
ncbi:type IV pilus assembly protein PilY1 [Variovorax sp. YR750]|uniref:pilus assembly protein n=1 Tax=Variovorax sp. YR750 TaxID=1884384 RepID=UPI0008D68914|nr:PilC/PilY family type IV pilus protein [Variovorax sp. YR750]SEK68258.1 type IV pilus assembly protein PilY1 [Variovorax sp. YR750]